MSFAAEQAKVLVAVEDLQPLKAPRARQAGGVVEGTFEFLGKRYLVLEERANGNEDFVLLADPDKLANDQQVGWVEKKFVVGEPLTRDGVPVRVMIRPSENALDDAVANKHFKDVAVRAGPGENAREIDRAPLGSCHYVFGRAGNFLLVGGLASLSADGVQSEVLYGWIPRRHSVEGDSRLTYWWNHKTANKRAAGKAGQAFKSPEDAHKSINGENVAPLFIEMLNSEYPALDRGRFVAFDYEGNPQFPKVVDDNTLLKLGVIAERGLDEQGRQKNNDKIESLFSQINNQMDLVFVIDDTASMTANVPVISEIVTEIISTLGQNEERPVRVAISYFNDKDIISGMHRAVSNPLAPLEPGKQGIQMLQEELRGHEATRWVAGDPAEMVLDGIEKAIEAADYDPDADKMIVVIGADEDKSVKPGLHAGLQATLRVVDFLRPNEIRPIEFYAVQLEDQDGDRIKFQHQMKDQILELFRSQHSDNFPKKNNANQLGGFVHSDNKDAVADMVLQQNSQSKKNKQIAISGLQNEIYGKWNTIFGPKIFDELPNRGIDRKLLPGDADEYGQVFVWEYDDQGNRQILPWVLMDDGELGRYISFMQGFDRQD